MAAAALFDKGLYIDSSLAQVNANDSAIFKGLGNVYGSPTPLGLMIDTANLYGDKDAEVLDDIVHWLSQFSNTDSLQNALHGAVIPASQMWLTTGLVNSGSLPGLTSSYDQLLYPRLGFLPTLGRWKSSDSGISLLQCDTKLIYL